ncbi:DUF5317 family protein [Alicyclobacillus dauci]|uniref:DUF5317 domain-containing protein n=1 Tax=Alicyclobacillus dauci TaxID=1475485 RepID=A0ABY6Z349_9BACL|nr:DUF5317 family protein [Alicyclobacillus dauci]WAH36756.1 DUF5317 domain-containing protein [Alicyclobacillus dauci]
MPYFVAIGIVWAYLTKRDLRSLLSMRFKYPYLILSALVFQILFNTMPIGHSGLMTVLYVLSFGCIVIGLMMNWNKPGFKLILVGSMLNLLVILANDGTMPVYLGTAHLLHLSQGSDYLATHHFIDSNAWDWWLSDWLPLPLFIMSPGDIFVGIGVIQLVLLNGKRQRE